MNRRSFIKNTALAATLVGIAPAAMASDLQAGKKKKVIFVLRGVRFSDAETSFKKLNLTDPNLHFQKVICTNQTFSHTEGMENIIENHTLNYHLVNSQNEERYQIPELIQDNIHSTERSVPIVYLHHTEIGHSSNKLYLEKLDEFFTEIKKIYDPNLHQFIITADIGRNEKLNSCGGKDHSNATCLETFVLYMGGKASKLTSNTNSITQNQILTQKF